MLKLFLSIPLVSSLIKLTFKKNNILLEKEVFGLKFPNPVGLAAGFDKNAKYIKELSSLGFGFIEIGTVTPKAQPGNPKKRVFRLIDDNALINRLGINNDGCEVCSERLKNNKENIIIGGNIGKNTNTDNENAIEDYVINFNTLHPYVDYFVLNVSCPNVSNFTKLQDVEFLKNLLPKLKKINENKNKPKPILIKISPDLSTKQLDETIDLIISENLDGIIATNTSTNRENLKTTENELKEIGNGGLSGNPIKNRSNEVISYISKKTNKKLPIIGVGGIMSAQDAVDKLNAGADLVQIYTGFIYAGPSIIKQINELIIKNYTKS
jgi:dihydroorotate dehydrogenase